MRPVEAIPKIQFPYRRALDVHERSAVIEALAHYWHADPEYQGFFEDRYTHLFCEMMQGGYADSVATGTAAVFVAVAALGLPKNSTVLCSPITDPGTLSGIILNGHRVKLIDSAPDSYNVGEKQICDVLEKTDAAAVIVHAMGRPAQIANVVKLLPMVEDCSQAHFARLEGRYVGKWGEIAAFSTMARKAHITGGCGGLVYTQSLPLHHLALAHADRGKPRWREDFNDRDPSQFLFPALNLHADEISCAIGFESLKRLHDTKEKRLRFVADLSFMMGQEQTPYKPITYSPNDSPFACPVFVEGDKTKAVEKLRQRGVPLNPHYQYLCADWPWLRPYLVGPLDTPNARKARDSSFVLYLNENYGIKEASQIWDAMQG